MRRHLPFIIVAAVALLTLGTGIALYRAKRLPVLTSPTDSLAPETAATESIHVRGDAKARVTLEEFGDFQCPPCGQVAILIKQVEQDYGARLRAIFRQFPLPASVHAHAQEAGLASEAAGFQGRFWEMHDLLYREQDTWGKAADARSLFRGYAKTLELNLERFEKDMDSPEAKERVESDQRRGTAKGVAATPTIFVNDRQVPAPVVLASLHTAIDEALKPQSPP